MDDYVPDVRFERTSVMGALGLLGVIALLTYKGTLNGTLFGEYVKEFLAPALIKGDTLILDNCSIHKVKDVLKPLIDKEVNTVFLPSYSPDFNPIELAWSKMKAFLCKMKLRDADELLRAIGNAHDIISNNDLLAWITPCRYRL